MSFRSKRVDETRRIVVSFADFLAVDELLSGTPTVEEVSTSDLTITSEAINDTETALLHGRTVPISNAVTFLVSAGVAGREYTLDVTVETDAGQVLTKQTSFRVN